jgi:hypothetical protein
MAEYYEVFDTMKRDMLKQSLIVAKIKEQQCEAHLQIMREYRRAEEQLQSTQPPPVNQHTEWATVATQAIRTIGELGKELLTSRATKQIEKQRAATEQRADEGRKATDEKPARRAAAEQTTTTVAAVQGVAPPSAVPAATVSTSPARTAPVGAMDAIEALCAKAGSILRRGRWSAFDIHASRRADRKRDRPPNRDEHSATASITPTITPNVTVKHRRHHANHHAKSRTERASGRWLRRGFIHFHDRRQTIREGDPCDGNAACCRGSDGGETEAIVTPSVTPSVSQNERGADGSDEGSLSAKASESPAGTASPTVKQTAEPPTETAQTGASKGSSLTLSQNPYVKSWRSIKSFVRRMTDMDLMIFTSSIPMFRSFLAMLRALTPYYQGPTMSLDELTEMAAAPP